VVKLKGMDDKRHRSSQPMVPPHDSRLSPHAPHARGRGGCLPSVRLLILLAAIGGAASLVADEPTAERSPHDELHRKYAEARLELAELDLEKADLLDAQGSGRTVSEHDRRRLRTRVAVLRELVAANHDPSNGVGIQGQRVRARAGLQLAKDDLEEAKAIHDRDPSDFTALAVRRYQSKADIAGLRLALLDDPANVPSLIDQMQMQIDLLTDQVIDLMDQADNDRIMDRLRQ